MKLLAVFLSTWLLSTICQAVQFKPYWRIGTKKCQESSLDFTGIPKKFGIVQNGEDQINGEEIVVLYRPGLYPHIKVDSEGNIQQINGGVPQNVNWREHMDILEQEINDQVDPDFSGIGIIQLYQSGTEKWRLLYDQDWGTMKHYNKISYDLANPELDGDKRRTLAKYQFEKAARGYMERTLRRIQYLRPKALWGFDDVPNCFGAPFTSNSSCTDNDRRENDRLEWFWKLQDVLMPYMHSYNESDVDGALRRSGTRIDETKRVIRKYNPDAKIIFHMEIRREDGMVHFNKEVISASLRNMIDYDCDGVILYDSSTELNSEEECQKLLDHLNNVLGPQIEKDLDYAQINNKCLISNESEINTNESSVMRDSWALDV